MPQIILLDLKTPESDGFRSSASCAFQRGYQATSSSGFLHNFPTGPGSHSVATAGREQLCAASRSNSTVHRSLRQLGLLLVDSERSTARSQETLGAHTAPRLFIEDSEDDAKVAGAAALRQGGYDVFHERVDPSRALPKRWKNRGTLSFRIIPCPISAERMRLKLVRDRGLDVPSFLFLNELRRFGGGRPESRRARLLMKSNLGRFDSGRAARASGIGRTQAETPARGPSTPIAAVSSDRTLGRRRGPRFQQRYRSHHGMGGHWRSVRRTRQRPAGQVHLRFARRPIGRPH